MANPFRLPPSFHGSMGFTRGVRRDWHFTVDDEEILGEMTDKTSLLLSRFPEKGEGVTREVVELRGGGKLIVRARRSGKTFLRLFAPLHHIPHVRCFNGALMMLKDGLPSVRPAALLERGGGLRPLDTMAAFRIEDGFKGLREFLSGLEQMPAPECSLIWRALGEALGRIHERGYVVGISGPDQIWVRQEKDGVAVLVEPGEDFDVRPVLRRQKECADITGANFVFDPRIAPLDRLRFFRAYCKARGMGRKELRELIRDATEMVRLRAMKEWKIYPTDIPKKTTLLNLIRALDKHSEQEGR